MTNDDRELLKFAAIASGELQGKWIDNEAYFEGVLRRWNPLENDGDAFRLAVQLFRLLNTFKFWRLVVKYLNQELSDDWDASARRAIVCAAAEVGRKLG